MSGYWLLRIRRYQRHQLYGQPLPAKLLTPVDLEHFAYNLKKAVQVLTLE